MKLSARNQLPGRIVSVTKGAVTTVVKVEIPAPSVISSTITNDAAEDLKLAVGDSVVAIIKSSEVIIGKE